MARKSRQRPPSRAPRTRCPAVWLVIACLITLIWQRQFLGNHTLGGRDSQLSANIGLAPDIRQFFYFFYYLNVFPVGAIPEGRVAEDIWKIYSFDRPPFLPVSRAGAEEFVRQHGDQLIMDCSQPASTLRSGEFFKLFLFLPNAWLSGSA